MAPRDTSGWVASEGWKVSCTKSIVLRSGCRFGLLARFSIWLGLGFLCQQRKYACCAEDRCIYTVANKCPCHITPSSSVWCKSVSSNTHRPRRAGFSPGLALFAIEHAVSAELLAEQTDTRAGLLQWHLPADGGVDLQPPDEAFPPFLWSDIMQSSIMHESPQDTI